MYVDRENNYRLVERVEQKNNPSASFNDSFSFS